MFYLDSQTYIITDPPPDALKRIYFRYKVQKEFIRGLVTNEEGSSKLVIPEELVSFSLRNCIEFLH